MNSIRLHAARKRGGQYYGRGECRACNEEIEGDMQEDYDWAKDQVLSCHLCGGEESVSTVYFRSDDTDEDFEVWD